MLEVTDPDELVTLGGFVVDHGQGPPEGIELRNLWGPT